MRRPEHRFAGVFKPFELQPTFIAPVLPGERLINATWQTRAVTDPIKSNIVGWWYEHYMFYVPLSTLSSYQSFSDLVENGDLNTVIAATAADTPTYYAGRGVNWALQCRDAVVREWFRLEDEQASSPLPSIRTGRPAVRLNMPGLHQSLRMDSAFPGGDGGALGATQRAQEDALRTYEYLREQGMIQMDFEDYLRSYGVRAPESIRRKRPYLLRYTRDWQYPSNTVEGTTGVPVSAVSWGITGRADKRRTFVEPGFICGYAVCRPKVYMANQEAHGASVMDRLRYWLPALLRDDPETSLRADTATSSPLYDTILAAASWIDVRDLLTEGDQWVDVSGLPAAGVNSVGLPTAAGEAQYPTSAQVDGLFVNSGATLGFVFCRADSVCRLNIRAAVEDAVDATAAT